MTVLHEPFCNLRDYGETDARDQTFDSPVSLLAWLRDETHDMRVFLDHPPGTRVVIGLLGPGAPAGSAWARSVRVDPD